MPWEEVPAPQQRSWLLCLDCLVNVLMLSQAGKVEALSTLCFLNIEIGILDKNCAAWRLAAAALFLDHTKLCREFVTFYSK